MSRRPEAGELELFAHRFAAVAEQMGAMLERSALSTSIRERLDFSCAVLDAAGQLVVNAPHIPVHLGSLGLCVRAVARRLSLGPDDVAVTNHPAFGGSHLPDVTVVAPVHGPSGRLLAHVACRAHHAEIGGIQPGSMSPEARCLAEEGVVIPPTHLVRDGRPRWDRLRERLSAPPHPSRAVEENLVDLAAQLAAVRYGQRALQELAARHGERTVARQMVRLREVAAAQMAGALATLPPGERRAVERLDDGSPLAVTLRLGDGRLEVDFGGSAPVHPGNLNATPAIVTSALLYVLRVLVDRPLPLNEGLLEPVTLRIPPGILNPPFPDDPSGAPAVVGGNVETSQRLVDLLFKALGLAACSQGTMNNVAFGTRTWGYYETVCGGAGAGPGFHGAHAVHTHMTNTRATDPEVLERRYPVRLRRFAIRRGSGGAGRWPGGDGVVREIEFLAPMRLALLTQHRTVAPYGMAGGEAGAPGCQHLVRADGRVEELAPVDGCEVGPGDRLVLETPGGGGWGVPADGEGPCGG